MATKTASPPTSIEKELDSFMVFYNSFDIDDPRPMSTGTKAEATIICYNRSSLAGVINFYEHQPPPVNSYRVSQHSHIIINFHISRFNDIINILQNHSGLSLWLDFNRLDGALLMSAPDPTPA